MPSQDKRIVPVILAGGKGTRLWPLSREARPKQFLPLVDRLSLLQLTLKRVADPELYSPPIVVTHEDYRFMVAEQAEECGVALDTIILEPVARNTAAAIVAAAEIAADRSGGRIMHVLPADHLIDANAGYFDAIRAAKDAARDGNLVTFGIPPREPATGYGYIEAEGEDYQAVKVRRFVEKPDAASAARMLEDGGYFWNSGMFMLGAETFLSECAMLAPDVLGSVQKSISAAQPGDGFLRLDELEFSRSPDISVDYAIFEKSASVAMVKMDVPWSDLGSWGAVWQTDNAGDENNNFSRGPTHLSDTRNSLIYSVRDLVVVSGLDDVAVIASEDAVFVGRLSDAQTVGTIVKTLRTAAETEELTQSHQTTHRPWGGYSSIGQGERYQVKRLFVKPGKKLSLQKHQHRAEHWIVVSGTAEVTINDVVKTVSENESVYLPCGAVHRLANPGNSLLELIEVQTGTYLGEDDIIRFKDEFGRV